MREDVRGRVGAALSVLVGLELTAARRAATLLTLQFGPLRPRGDGSVGDHALHAACAWRIDGPAGIVTGRADLFERLDAARNDSAEFDYDREPNLRDVRVREWLAAGPRGVEGVDADEFGGAAIRLAGGFALRLFPSGTRGEDWRLFRPGGRGPHFVVIGGTVEGD